MDDGRKRKTIGRRTLQKYIKIFKDELSKKYTLEDRFLKQEIDILEQAANSGIIWDEIKHIEIYTPDQKEYVYDFTVPTNQTFMEDNGVIVHNTLNTFHFAGVASKSNVTRGVPRIEEILSLSENPKNPSVTIMLNNNDRERVEKAQEIKYNIEYTCLRDVTSSVSICFDPDDANTLIEVDKPLMEEYIQFKNMIKECDTESFEKDTQSLSKWIIRFELDRESMLEKNISLDSIHFAIKHSYKEAVSCIYSDYNSNNLIFRIRLDASILKNKKKPLDQDDEIYKLKQLQQTILNNIILRGVKGIPKIILRKSVNNLVLNDGNYEVTKLLGFRYRWNKL